MMYINVCLTGYSLRLLLLFFKNSVLSSTIMTLVKYLNTGISEMDFNHPKCERYFWYTFRIQNVYRHYKYKYCRYGVKPHIINQSINQNNIDMYPRQYTLFKSIDNEQHTDFLYKFRSKVDLGDRQLSIG